MMRNIVDNLFFRSYQINIVSKLHSKNTD